MRAHYLIIPLSLLLFGCFNQCKKQDIMQSNIVLYNKPLKTIQHYIQGKWKLQYSYGGFSTHKYIDTHNSYMILSPERIIMGNDSTGVVVDTTIVWVRTETPQKEVTYLLSFSWSGNYWPEYLFIDQIKSDSLIINDNKSDGFSYFYTKY